MGRRNQKVSMTGKVHSPRAAWLLAPLCALVCVLLAQTAAAGEPVLEPPAGELPQEPPPSAPLAPPQIEHSAADVYCTILFTGDSHAYLDIAEPDVGGLARRATFIANVQKQGLPTLVLDAGGLFSGSEEYDQLRAALYLRLVTLLGYRALNLSPSELSFGWLWLADTLKAYPAGEPAPLVSGNIVLPDRYKDLPIHSAGTAEVGPWKIGIVGFAYPSEFSTASVRDQWAELIPSASALLDKLDKQVDAIIVLAELPRKQLADVAALRGVDLIISADAGPDLEQIGTVPVVHCRPNGVAIGQIDAIVNAQGLRVLRATPLPLTARVLRDPGVEEVLKLFRADTYEKLHGEKVEPPIQEPGKIDGQEAAFVGASLCSACHKDEFAQWRQTRHARACDSLYKDQRQFMPACQTCHTTGYGHSTGYDPKVGTPEFRNVQCEGCHGPGSVHSLNPTKSNVRPGKDPALCRRCHDTANSPQFERQQQRYFDLINHRQILLSPPMTPEVQPKPVAMPAPVPVGSKPLVELFVMSLCPYAVKAENVLLPWAKEMKELVEFRIHFIAREQKAGTQPPPSAKSAEDGVGGLRLEPESQCSGSPQPSEGPFASLHGQAEVDEGVRQAVILELFPDKAFDYMLCRNKSIRSADWRACAVESGIDPEFVARMATGRDGEDIFRRNIARALELGVQSSPSVYVDGRKLEGQRQPADVAARICAAQPNAAFCAQQPECEVDSDCDQPGKVGLCLDAGTLHARCKVSEPVPFDVTIINAPMKDCPVCYSGPGLRSIMRLFPYARLRSLAYEDPAAQELIRRDQLDALPAYLFSERIREAPRFEQIKEHLTDRDGHLLLDPGLSAVSYFADRPLKRSGIDLWVEPHSEASQRVMAAIIRHMAQRKGYCNFHFLVSPRTGPLPKQPGKPWPVVERYSSANSEPELEEAARQLCIQQRYPTAFYKYVLAYNALIGAPWASQQSLKSVRLPQIRVERCASGQEGFELMNRDYALGKELHVGYAPMVLINNRLLMAAESIELVKQVYDELNPPEEKPAVK